VAHGNVGARLAPCPVDRTSLSVLNRLVRTRMLGGVGFLLPTNTLKREESAEREKFGEWVLSHRLPCASVVLRLEKEEVQDRERLA